MITLKQFSPDDKDRMLEILTDPQIKQTYMLPDFEEKADAVPLLSVCCSCLEIRSILSAAFILTSL